ncbi:MAG: hypothetical protein ABIH82_01615, partial [Candidatus Woesearchaeota archaeon]
GKAFFADITIVEEGQAGIFLGDESPVLNVGDTLTVPIYAHIGAEESVAVGFTLNYPSTLTPNCDTILNNLKEAFTVTGSELTMMASAECTGNQIMVQYAGLCADLDCTNALTGPIHLADLDFTVNSVAASYPLTFAEFTVIQFSGHAPYTFTSIQDATVIPAAVGCDPECAADEVCTDGECVKVGVEICDGIDNDGDSEIDEGLTQTCSITNDYGLCTGTESCSVGSWGICTAETPTAEICDDGTDNDCDTLIDCNDPDCVEYTACVDTALNIMEGVKIKAEEVSPVGNVYTTKIIATENITIPFKVFTTLFAKDDRKLEFLTTTIQNMTKDEEIIVSVINSQLGETVVKKQVNAYDTFNTAIWTMHLNNEFTVNYP